MTRIGLAWTGLAVLVAGVAVDRATVLAQRRVTPPVESRILSGSDVGFRVEGVDPTTGGPTGTWMVRINGTWVEIGSSPVMKRLK